MTREEFDEKRRSISDDNNVFYLKSFLDQNMSGLYLHGTVFRHCCFVHTIFYGSCFKNCVFHDCLFRRCDFSGVVFSAPNVFMSCGFDSCDMKDAVGVQGVIFVNSRNEEGIIGAENLPIDCPSAGGFVGWKKCRVFNSEVKDAIVKLYIPARAKRTTGLDATHKCRASEAKVLGFYDENGKPLKLNEMSRVCSIYDPDFVYRIGETVRAEYAFDEKRITCGSGIHFFLDFKAAVEYILI